MKITTGVKCVALSLIYLMQTSAVFAAEPMTLQEETAARIAADEAEALVRSATDAALLSTINSNEATFNSATVALVAADGNEATARAAADAVLQAKDMQLMAADAAEASARAAADMSLQDAINAAIASATATGMALEAKDMDLMAADAAEAAAREAGDAAIQDALATATTIVQTKGAELEAKDMALMTADSAEAAAREAGDAAIQASLTSATTIVQTIGAELEAKDMALMAADGALETALTTAAAEAQAAAAALEAKDMLLMNTDSSLQNADSALQTAINAEAAARQAADDTLGALLGDIVQLPEGTVSGQLLAWDQGVETGEWVVRPAPSIGTFTPSANSNRQPYQTLTCIIALQGVYPSRSSIANPTIAEIMYFGGNFAPRSWAKCEGQLLPISQYTALFSLVGTQFGGDGRTTFGLPDLRGRVPLGTGNGPGLTPFNSVGQKGGSERDQAHTHVHN